VSPLLRSLIAGAVGFIGGMVALDVVSEDDASTREPSALAVALRDAAEREAARPAPHPLPDGPVLRRGRPHPTVSDLSRRVADEPHLDQLVSAVAPHAGQSVWNPSLETNVRALQYHHGLVPDGVVGPHTRALLALSPDQRAARLLAARDRLLRLPGDGMGLEVLVELSRPVATVWDDGQLVSTHRVLIGVDDEDNATPEVSGTIDRVVFHPRWIVPRRIALEELVRQDPDRLTDRGFEVVGRRLRWPVTSVGLDKVRAGEAWLEQGPGPHNPLGQVKLLFDNPDGVALHGTTAAHLFSHARRTHTHGCVRVDNALMLGMWAVLQQPGWDHARLAKVLVGGEEVEVVLPRPVSVHLVDLPAGLSPQGIPVFPPDVYGRHGTAQP